MSDNCIGDIEVHLVDGERRLRSNGVSADFKVTVDVADVASSPICSLDYDCIKICLEGVDESALGDRGSRFDSVKPESFEDHVSSS